VPKDARGLEDVPDMAIAAPLSVLIQHPALGLALLLAGVLMLQGPGKASYRVRRASSYRV
jgi:hypothetical protein